MRGKTEAGAKQTLEKFIKDMEKAQDDFDVKEGFIIVDHKGPTGNAGPATDVHTGPKPTKTP